jgi:hypothetical protein
LPQSSAPPSLAKIDEEENDLKKPTNIKFLKVLEIRERQKKTRVGRIVQRGSLL